MIRLAFILCLLLAPAAVAREIVFLVRTGTDAEGNPQFRTADARDGHLVGIFDLTQGSRALQETTRYADATQQTRGQSPLPVFIEVTNGSGNAYNDWRGRFSVAYPDGRNYTVSTPRVVIGLGSDVVRSGNRALLEQTLVHEVGHGVMAQVYGPDALPQTPWLSRPHAGGTVTDEQLSLIEGWAEFTGAYFTGRRTIAEDPADTLQSNWYARRADGSMKSAEEVVRTEGWTATILYQIATRARDQNAMWKLTDAMARTRPQSTMNLLATTGSMYPELVPAIRQVLAETSGGQIVDPGIGGTVAAPQASAASPDQLTALYYAKSQQLAAEPWWKFWVKSRLRREMDEIASVLAQQQSPYAQTAAAPAAPRTREPSAAPAGPATPLRSYRDAVKQLSAGGPDTDAIERFRQEQDRRRRERRAEPTAER